VKSAGSEPNGGYKVTMEAWLKAAIDYVPRWLDY